MSAIDQIKTLLLMPGTPYKAVLGATDLATAMKVGPKAIPSAYVFFGDEASHANAGGNGSVRQRMERNVSVVTALSNLTDDTGAAALDDLEPIKTFVRGKLIGLVINGDPAREPITHVQGAVAAFDNGVVWYEDVFSAPTYLKELSA